MKIKNLFFIAALVMLTGVFFTSCSQSTNKTTTADTEITLESADQTAKCGEGTDTTSKCGEGKCGEGKCGDASEDADTSAKCGEAKCGA